MTLCKGHLSYRSQKNIPALLGIKKEMLVCEASDVTTGLSVLLKPYCNNSRTYIILINFHFHFYKTYGTINYNATVCLSSVFYN